MTKKDFVITTLLSVLITYLIPAIEILIGGWSLSGGNNGLPLKFHTSFFSGYSKFNFVNFIIDVIFWFIIIFLFEKFILKKFQKR